MKIEVSVIGKPYQGRAVGDSFMVSRRDARVLVAIGKVATTDGYLRRDMVAGPGNGGAGTDDGQRISAAARKAAEEAGIVLESIIGTGKDGRVTKADVDAVIESARNQQE